MDNSLKGQNKMKIDTALRTQYLELAEGRIAYDDTRTSGPLVICVPGLGDVRATYRFLAPSLATAGYRVVTMDLRGIGESSVNWPDYRDTSIAGDVLALIRALDAGPALLLGNSYSGAAVTYAAATDPEAVAALVLFDAFVRDLPQNLIQRLGIWLIARLGAWAWVSYYKSLYTSTPPTDFATYLAELKANLKEPGRFAAVQYMMFSSHATVEAHLAQVQAPTLIVMGLKDPDFPDPAAEARRTAEQLRNAAWTDVQLIAGAGHYPYAEMSDQVQPTVFAFFERLKKDSTHGA